MPEEVGMQDGHRFHVDCSGSIYDFPETPLFGLFPLISLPIVLDAVVEKDVAAVAGDEGMEASNVSVDGTPLKFPEY